MKRRNKINYNTHTREEEVEELVWIMSRINKYLGVCRSNGGGGGGSGACKKTPPPVQNE